MKYLLDTCVVSDFVKGEKNTLSKLKEIHPNEIAISSITVMEIQYGIALNPKIAEKIESIMLDFFSAITILDFSQSDAEESAKIRAMLKKSGKQIGSYDVLLAGTALSNQLILVTSNTGEFERVKNLDLEDWRQALE